MDATIWYAPAIGKTYNAPDAAAAPPDGEWKVLCCDDAVSILAPKEGRLVLIGSGKWDGKHIEDRYQVSESAPITRSTWARFEYALHRSATGVHVPFGDTEYAKVDDGKPVAHVQGSSSVWAVATCLVVLAGAVIAWRALQPGDRVGLLLAIGLGVGALGLILFSGYGRLTQCPRCESWYRRVYLSTESLGTKHVTDHYRVTPLHHRYRCTECTHTWTSTSEWRRG